MLTNTIKYGLSIKVTLPTFAYIVLNKTIQNLGVKSQAGIVLLDLSDRLYPNQINLIKLVV